MAKCQKGQCDDPDCVADDSPESRHWAPQETREQTALAEQRAQALTSLRTKLRYYRQRRYKPTETQLDELIALADLLK